jgi:hypothetical protein
MSEVKVNKISPRSGTEVTLGDSGDTFTIPSGATINNQGTATNFGATGSASWNTTVKTGDFTAVAGEGYFVNTTSGEIDVALPAGTAGAVVAVKDYAGTFDDNKVTLVLNGSDKIGGVASNAILNTEGIAVTLVFIDSTQGWLITDDGLQSKVSQPTFIAATGGTITTVCTDYKVHTFTGPGTFCVSSIGNASGSNTVSYMVVAGGAGGGGQEGSGGGGAGGYREGRTPQCNSWTASPLNAPAGLPVSVQGYPITVGAAGTGGQSPGSPQRGGTGGNSIFSTITSAGGGGGGTHPTPTCGTGAVGGSGGGGGGRYCFAGGAGNTPPVSPSQGNNGGAAAPGPTPSTIDAGGGGGGATAIGANAAANVGAAGGAGATSSITGSPVARAGGGGGGTDPGASPGIGGAGGSGGGGAGANADQIGANGTTNTGGGGGGSGRGSAPSPSCKGGAGGSGIVVIRYKFQ